MNIKNLIYNFLMLSSFCKSDTTFNQNLSLSKNNRILGYTKKVFNECENFDKKNICRVKYYDKNFSRKICVSISNNYLKTLNPHIKSRIIQYFVELSKKSSDEIISTIDKSSNTQNAYSVIIYIGIGIGIGIGIIYFISNGINNIIASPYKRRKYLKEIEARKEITTLLAEKIINYDNIMSGLARNENFFNNIEQENDSPTDAIVIRKLKEENNANSTTIDQLANENTIINFLIKVMNNINKLLFCIVNYRLTSPDNMRKLLEALNGKPEIIVELAEEINNYPIIIYELARNQKFVDNIKEKTYQPNYHSINNIVIQHVSSFFRISAELPYRGLANPINFGGEQLQQLMPSPN